MFSFVGMFNKCESIVELLDIWDTKLPSDVIAITLVHRDKHSVGVELNGWEYRTYGTTNDRLSQPDALDVLARHIRPCGRKYEFQSNAVKS